MANFSLIDIDRCFFVSQSVLVYGGIFSWTFPKNLSIDS
jgi:hypothetical protein